MSIPRSRDKLPNNPDPLAAELTWHEYLKNKTPMGQLFTTNGMFASIKKGRGLTLAHVTTSLKEIEDNGYLYASGGCLGASIYATPVNQDGTIHNLTKFLLDYEIPNSLKAQGKIRPNISILAIRIPQLVFRDAKFKNWGFDYFSLGEIQAKVLKQLLELRIFPPKSLSEIEGKILKQIEETMELLHISSEYQIDTITTIKFFDLFKHALSSMPFLGYVYFETLLEYVSLFQDDDIAWRYYTQGELYNYHFKKLVFNVCPPLLAAFKLVKFRPSIESVVSYLRQNSKNGRIIKKFSAKHFTEFMKWRIAQYIRCKMMNGQKLPKKFVFDTLLEHNSSLIGHLFHKTFRQIPELAQQYFLYEELRAEIIWNKWNENFVTCPYNSIVPKGEVGINPRLPNLKYSICVAKAEPKSGQLVIERETDIKLAPKLINPGLTLLRAPHKLPFNI